MFLVVGNTGCTQWEFWYRPLSIHAERESAERAMRTYQELASASDSVEWFVLDGIPWTFAIVELLAGRVADASDIERIDAIVNSITS